MSNTVQILKMKSSGYKPEQNVNILNTMELYILTWLNYVNVYFTTILGFPGGSV